MTTADAQDRLYDLHAGLTPNQRAVVYVEEVRRSCSSTSLDNEASEPSPRVAAMSRACTNLYGGTVQDTDAFGPTDRTLNQKQTLRDVVTLVRMIDLVNEGLENALHEISMRAAQVVRMLQTVAVRAEKGGGAVDKGLCDYLAYRAFLVEAGRIRASLWELLKNVYAERAVVESISQKYFYRKPILFREKERQLAHTLTWLLAAIDEYNAIVREGIDAGGAVDGSTSESKAVASNMSVVRHIYPEEVQEAASNEDRRQHIRVLEASARYVAMRALGESPIPPSSWVEGAVA